MANHTDEPARDFIRQIVADDVAAGKHGGRVVTRFPPEPNGYLHIGHAKAICLDFGVAEEFDGVCHLRMDDTNPETAHEKYVEAIAGDIRWLGFEWEGEIRYASDYYERLYALAVQLVRDGLAYVDSSTEDEIRELRGTVTRPGRPGPYRDRPVEESLELFEGMRNGDFEEGEHVLRAKIDLAHSNMKMRDPLLYRIRKTPHYRTGDEWPIYPMYDWAHPLGDAIEGITHSFCTLEFEVNRPLYDWVVDHTRPDGPDSEPGSWDPRPRQYEFARLNLDYTVMSKRKLARLVREGHVDGWDDPRMPTLAGLRRRGVPPEAIRSFIDMIGLTKADQRADIGKLEHAIRDDLNQRAPRVLCVLDPLKVVIENHAENVVDWLDAPYYPDDIGKPGFRKVPFGRVLYIDRDDFREDPPEGFYRLAPGREVRLRYGYFITCTDSVRDEVGRIVELRCTYDPDTRGGSAPDGRSPKGTIHWVSAEHALPAEVRLYDRLFAASDPEAGTDDFEENLNPESLQVVAGAMIEPSVEGDPPGTHYQFERQGYFIRDTETAEDEELVFNRTVPLRDTWARRSRPEPPPEKPGLRSKETGRGAGPTDDRVAEEPPHTDGQAGGRSRRRAQDRERARAARPELAEKYRRYRQELGLPDEDADILSGDPATAAFFDEALETGANPRSVANWLIHELRGLVEDRELDELPFTGDGLGDLVELIDSGRITQTAGREVLEQMLEDGGDPARIVEQRGLQRIEDADRLRPTVDRVVSEHPEEAERYRQGQEGLVGFFLGQVMRATDGKADPLLARRLLVERLSGS